MTGATTTAAAMTSQPIFGKKFMSKLGGMANEEAGSNVSAFARKQMEKMGWTDGKGLGKKEQGIVTHVRVKKREESMGIGVEKVQVEEHKNQWWYNAYDNIAGKIQIAPDTDDDNDEDATASSKQKKAAKKAKKKAKADKKRAKQQKRQRDDSTIDNVATKKCRIPTDEELFAATGGKLFGRRAYGSCNGKLKRDALLQSGEFLLHKTQTVEIVEIVQNNKKTKTDKKVEQNASTTSDSESG